jgi:hypothetical protein
MKGRGDRRIFRADEHLFRVAVDRPKALAEVHRDGRWTQFVLTNEEVISLINIAEVGSDEARELGLLD